MRRPHAVAPVALGSCAASRAAKCGLRLSRGACFVAAPRECAPAKDKEVQICPQWTVRARLRPDSVGLLLGIELDPALGGAAKFVQAAADRGLLLVPAGVDVVRFVPPLVVTAAQIDKALAILGECLASA